MITFGFSCHEATVRLETPSLAAISSWDMRSAAWRVLAWRPVHRSKSACSAGWVIALGNTVRGSSAPLRDHERGTGRIGFGVATRAGHRDRRTRRDAVAGSQLRGARRVDHEGSVAVPDLNEPFAT